MARQSRYGLGKLQAEVLDFVWQRGEATVGQVADELGKQRRVMYTTVLSAMQKLEKKGWLTHRAEGRAYVYRPTKTRHAVNTSMLKELLKNAFGGDPRLLLSNLLDEHPLSDEQLRDLRRVIDRRRKERNDG